jgi:cytochrome b561
MNKQLTPQYDLLSRLFHWITAIVVAIAFILGPGGFGRLMRNGIDPATHSDIVWHETLGVLVFTLTLLRLLWLAFRPKPPQIAVPGWMHFMGKLAHLSLWLLLLVVPMTAVMALGSEGHPLTLLAGLRIEHFPLISNGPFAHLADWGEVHQFLGDAIVWIAGLHAAAAIYHGFILKDGLLATMLPYKWFH